MPLLDHFRPPVYPRHRWESFHSNWATRIADALNERLPEEFLAEEYTHSADSLEIDIATYETDPAVGGNGKTATLTWRPQAAALVMPAAFPDNFEIKVFGRVGGMNLVAAIELVSPGNKDRPAEVQAFASKVATYLHQGVAVIVIDIVTARRANVHNATMRLMSGPAAALLPDEVAQYAVSYRPVLRDNRPEIEQWRETFAVGEALPTMPLRITGDFFVPVEFETAYTEACRRRRIVP
jgi:Protein of unknown function (DUF4058)